MMTRARVLFLSLLLALVVPAFAPSLLMALPAVASDSSGTAATFSVASQTQVPGRTLAPGTYTIRVVDRLSDRMILEVVAPGGKRSTFLALPHTRLSIPASSGPVILHASAPSAAAVRGFKFADGTFAEFVYPKAEAVSLAKANSTTIPAVDPASEGRSPLPKLSHADLEEVTLWMLTPAPVGPDASGPGVTAARYQAPPASEVASNQPAPKPHPRVAKPAVAVLPHTASMTPLLAVLALFSFAAATMFAVRRMRII